MSLHSSYQLPRLLTITIKESISLDTSKENKLAVVVVVVVVVCKISKLNYKLLIDLF